MDKYFSKISSHVAVIVVTFKSMLQETLRLFYSCLLMQITLLEMEKKSSR